MMNNRISIWKKIPSHITPKTADEMKLIRSQPPQMEDVSGDDKSTKVGMVTGVSERFKSCSFDNYLTNS